MPSPPRGPLTDAPLSLYAFAQHVGVDVEQVLKAVRNGRLERSLGTNAKGRPCIANGALAEQEWARNRDMRKVRGAGSGENMARERKRLLAAQAERAELDNRKKSGELVSAREVEMRWSRIVTHVRNHLLGLPSRIKGVLPHLSQSDVLAIDAQVRESLEQLADGANAKEK